MWPATWGRLLRREKSRRTVAGPSFQAFSLAMALVQPKKPAGGGYGQFLNVTWRKSNRFSMNQLDSGETSRVHEGGGGPTHHSGVEIGLG